jgi:dynein heavy chain
MSPERFTLGNMFAMQLHRYQDIAEGIIANAMKELAIEKGIKEIADIWNRMQFIVKKHVKGSDDMGFIMGPVDDIVLVLDDSFMNLQSMASSQ